MPLVNPRSITRRRFATGTRVGGRWVDGAPTDTPITASVQAPTGDDMEFLPEGTRRSQVRKLYATAGSLRTVNQHDDEIADNVIVDGVEYLVEHVTPWVPPALIPHDKVLVLRLKEPDTVSP
jgi:hypothetical protein